MPTTFEPGGGFAFRGPLMSLEVAIGRAVAYCCHPAAAWQLLSGRSRAFIVAAYVAAGYLTVLAALAVW